MIELAQLNVCRVIDSQSADLTASSQPNQLPRRVSAARGLLVQAQRQRRLFPIAVFIEVFKKGWDVYLVAMGEFGAGSVVSGHIRGQTNTLPLHIEILYNEYQMAASLVTLVLKYIVERRVRRELAQANEVGVPA